VNYTTAIPLPAVTWGQDETITYTFTLTLNEVTFIDVDVNSWGANKEITRRPVTYKANDGTGKQMIESFWDGYTLVPGVPDTFTPPPATDGFYGWNTQTNGNGDWYMPGDILKYSGNDLVLYARWVGALDLTGTELPPGMTFSSSSSTFTITDGGDYRFTGDVTDKYVAVAADVTCSVTLKDANITVNSFPKRPFLVGSGANVTLVLEGTNTVKSTKLSAGLFMNAGATLTITSAAGEGATDGELTVTSSNNSPFPGIGGTDDYQITITGGTVNATGGAMGAGIGGNGNVSGNGGAGGVVTITGGIVRATGGIGAPGIGGGGSNTGTGGDGGTLIITGGEVYATGGTVAPGIGGGNGGGGVGAPTNYFGPGAPAQQGDLQTDTYVWEGWDATHTAFVHAEGKTKAIDGVDIPPTP
jgi:hypothetical protein